VLTPVLTPLVLGDWRHRSGRCRSVGLHYGHPWSPEAPAVAVTSTSIDPPGRRRLADDDLMSLLAAERDRRADLYRATTGEESPTAGLRPVLGRHALHRARIILTVDGKQLPATIHDDGTGWCAYAEISWPPGEIVAITVIAFGVAPEQVRLTVVDDLEPFWAGRQELLDVVGRASHEATPPEDWDIPSAHGFDAHRALCEAILREQRALRDAMAAGRQPPRLRPERRLLWESAIRAQMRLASEDREEADWSVTSLVNHYTALSDLPWFADPALHGSALEETLRWVAFASEVDSRDAQQAWDDWWAARIRPLGRPADHGAEPAPPLPGDDEDDPDFDPGPDFDLEGELSWRAAWQQWVGRRH
jgi:hypothetical protein